MMRYAGPGHVELSGNLSGRQVFIAEHFEDLASGRIIQGFENGIQAAYLDI
jgi:hypothetical protein